MGAQRSKKEGMQCVCVWGGGLNGVGGAQKLRKKEIARRKMELRRGRQSRDWASETDGRGDWSSRSLRTAVL